MLNVKLVIIGASGVGKTSLRTKYTSGRFSTNYRATIGADFLSKTIPHYKKQEESVQLQIWDTAGQERFSSLATAFFRGADAVILVYDVTDPQSLSVLTKWWDEFRTRCPVEEGLEADFPVAVVGNKIDLIEMQDSGVWKRKHQRINSGGSQNGDKIITEEEAREFLRDLIPLKPEEETIRRTTSNSSDGPSVARSGSSRMNGSARYGNKGGPEPSQAAVPSTIPNASRLRNSSIREGLDSRATSRSRHIYGNGTMTSTAMSIYHTASSSLVDSGPPTPLRRGRDGNFVNGGAFWDPEVEQAIASNSAEIVGEGEVVLDSGYRSKDKATEGGDPSGGHGQLLDVPDDSPDPSTGRRRLFSSNSDSSVQTITPSRMQSDLATASDSTAQENTDVGKQISSYKPFSGPALFFASAKTGEGLSAVFEYIGERVSKKWEWEESRLHMLEGGGGPGTSGNGDSRIILREVRDNDAGREGGKKDWACC